MFYRNLNLVYFILTNNVGSTQQQHNGIQLMVQNQLRAFLQSNAISTTSDSNMVIANCDKETGEY